MIIKRLTMYNFGVYAGVQTFAFTNARPIVLISGMNGRGKTTFLEAILLALYGSNSIAYKENPAHGSYGQYLRSRISRQAGEQESFVELEFDMSPGQPDTYVVRRAWNGQGRRTAETVTVEENGLDSPFLTQNWTMFIESLLPSALSSFYFFDGEKIAELALDNKNTQMKDAIRSMLGIQVLDRLKKDLDLSLRHTRERAGEKDSGIGVQALRREKESREVRLEELNQRIEAQNEKIWQQRETVSACRRQYEQKGGDAAQQQQILLQRQADLRAEGKQTGEALLDLAAGALPLVLVEDLLQDVRRQAEEEHSSQVMGQALDRMEALLDGYAGDRAAAGQFVEYVKGCFPGREEEALYGLSSHGLVQLQSLLEKRLNQSRTEVQAQLKRKKELEEQLDETERYLSLDTNEKELNSLYAEIKEQEGLLLRLEVELNALQQEKSAVYKEAAAAAREWNRAVEAYLQEAELRDEADRMEKYTALSIRLVEEYMTRLQRRKTGVLGETITQCYRKLANKKDMIHKIEMDAETLDLRYLDAAGGLVAKDSLSAGEKQLMVIAILWALASCSRKKLPVIIDTPLARMDSMHRTALVTTYFPQASGQTIILSTDSEINRSYYALMQEYVGDEFTLVFDEQTQSTTISKGYFQTP